MILVANENIGNLETRTRSVLKELGYSESRIAQMLMIAKTLIRLHDEQDEKHLNSDIAKSYVAHQEMRYQNKEIGRKTFLLYKVSAEYLVQIHSTGTIDTTRHDMLPALPDYFERVLSDMLVNERWNLKFRKNQCCHCRVFFRWLSACGHSNLNHVDADLIRRYFADCSTRMVGGSLEAVRRALNELFVFISEDGMLPEPLHRLFLFRIPADKKIKPFMPQDDIAAVLNIIDRNTVQGKRDYAMILLAAVTGMRRADIAALSIDCVEWCSGEIRISQDKTDIALALPLTTDVGKAIREYILNARPQNGSDNIFLSTKAPYKGINKGVLNNILSDYCVKAGIPHRSPHSLRRGLATSMITSGVSVLTVAQALGHKSLESTKQYISLDSLNLKECALDFSGIPIGGNGL